VLKTPGLKAGVIEEITDNNKARMKYHAGFVSNT
jgi:hypothetical protein